MSKVLDLRGAGGKGAERQGDVPQLLTCAVVPTVPGGVVQSWAAQLLSLPEELFGESLGVSYGLKKKEKKAKPKKKSNFSWD